MASGSGHRSSVRLSYAHLFSFQVAYSNHADSRGYANQGGFGLIGLATSLAGRKKGEWKRAILEFDFVMETMFLQDKDRIVLSATFPTYRRTVSGGENEDDTLLSIRFEAEQWEILAQNVEEKKTILHLLECIGNNLSADKTAELGKQKGLIGVDKRVMKHGVLLRKAKTAYKKDERYIIVVPGKLLLFMTPDIVGKHVRYVTTLVDARVQLSRSQLTLEIMVPNTKDLAFSAVSMEGLSSWVKTIEASANGEMKVYHSSGESSDSGGSGSSGSDDGGNYKSSRSRRHGHGHRRHRRRRGSGGAVNDHEPDPNYNYMQQQQKIKSRPNPNDSNNYMRYVHDDDWPPPMQRAALGPVPMQLAAGPILPAAAGKSSPNANAINSNYPNMQLYDDQQHRPRYIVSEPDGSIDDMSTQAGGADETEAADRWLAQKTNYRNVQTRRRSVPLQCLDSALEEMASSIGSIGINSIGADPGAAPSRPPPPAGAAAMQIVPIVADNIGQQLINIPSTGQPHQSKPPSSSAGGGKKPPNLTRADTKAYGAIMHTRNVLPALPNHDEYADQYYNTSSNPSVSTMVSHHGKNTYAADTSQAWPTSTRQNIQQATGAMQNVSTIAAATTMPNYNNNNLMNASPHEQQQQQAAEATYQNDELDMQPAPRQQWAW